MEQHFNLAAWVDRRRRKMEARQEQAMRDHLVACDDCRRLDALAAHVVRISVKHQPQKPRAVTTACPVGETIALYFTGNLPFLQKREFERHLANCHDCRAILARQIKLEAAAAVPEEELSRVLSPIDASPHVGKIARRLELLAAEDAESSLISRLGERWRSVISYFKDVADDIMHLAPRHAAALATFLAISFIGGRSLMMWRSSSLATAGMQTLERLQEIRRDGFRLKGEFRPELFRVRGGGQATGNYLDATTQFEKSLWWNDENRDAKRGRALALFFAEDFTAAQSVLTELLSDDPKNPIILNDLGVMAAAQNEEEKALGYFSRALEANPGFVEARFNQAAALQKLKRFSEAQAAWETYEQMQDEEAWQVVADEHQTEIAESQNF